MTPSQQQNAAVPAANCRHTQRQNTAVYGRSLPVGGWQNDAEPAAKYRRTQRQTARVHSGKLPAYTAANCPRIRRGQFCIAGEIYHMSYQWNENKYIPNYEKANSGTATLMIKDLKTSSGRPSF